METAQHSRSGRKIDDQVEGVGADSQGSICIEICGMMSAFESRLCLTSHDGRILFQDALGYIFQPHTMSIPDLQSEEKGI
ncbi:hypothetical protein PAXRUDRAFT_831323, partial [Paxillus rubicundulus Ve08.2h10]